MRYIIKDATIVNEGQSFVGSVLIDDGVIAKIGKDVTCHNAIVISAKGKYLMPGIIDEHVHFREPGLTQKADIYTESRAALAGGVTSFMDMPNTVPQTTTIELLRDKFDLAAEKSLANFSFYLGATNDNINEIKKLDPSRVCGVKLFMGSSTGNMLVDDETALLRLFSEAPCLIAAHCEDEATIAAATKEYKKLVSDGKELPDASLHPLVRTAEACYKSSAKAVELASKANAHLHLMHISTQKELSLLDNTKPLAEKTITAETCPHYLLFDDANYKKKGLLLKCNPAIKSSLDRESLLTSLNSGLIDTIATDHAPHLKNEKLTDDYFTSKSGFPSVQHSLDVMICLMKKGLVSIETIVRLMCHNPAVLYKINRRGFVREGYHADLTLVELVDNVITNDEEYSKCAWTPYNGMTRHSRVTHTFVNGTLVYENGTFNEDYRGEKLIFDR